MPLEGDYRPEAVNKRAIQVIQRVQNKLTGRDFGEEALSVPQQVGCHDVTLVALSEWLSATLLYQVQHLIQQATSHQNLCQCFVGW